MERETLIFGYTGSGSPFREMLRIDTLGLIYRKSVRVAWSDIIAYRAFPDFLFDLVDAFVLSPKRRVRIYLSDGRILTLRGDLLRLDQDNVEPARAFETLVQTLGRHAPRWQGPREEVTLFATAWVLLVLGGAAGAGYAARSSVDLGIAEGAVISGVLLSQLAFLFAPLISRRVRRIYIAAHANDHDRRDT